MTDHLAPTTTDRGFDHMPAIPSQYGGHVMVYESSAAMSPHVWLRLLYPADLNRPEGPKLDGVAHLTAEDAWRLADQLRALVRNHYQGDAMPEWAGGDAS